MPACPDQLPPSFDAASAGIQAANLIRSASAILNFAALSYPGDSPERTRLLHYALRSQRLARAITRTKVRSSEHATPKPLREKTSPQACQRAELKPRKENT